MPISSLKENQKFSDTFFITLKTIKGYHLFTSKPYFNIILNSLKFCQEKQGLEIWAYTIIINHLHLVFKIRENFKAFKTIENFKRFTANQIIQQLKYDNKIETLKLLQYSAISLPNQKYKIWRKNNFPKAIVTPKFLAQKINYTDNNAVKHNIVNDIEDYPYTSYHNHYCNHPVLLKIFPIEFD